MGTLINFCMILLFLNEEILSTQETRLHLHEKGKRSLLSPNMEYNEWTPLGRGDPLKNDPTFDYSPPVLDRVKYWINPLYRTPDPPIVTEYDLLQSENKSIPPLATQPTIAKMNQKQNIKSEIKRFFNSEFKNDFSDPYFQANSKYNSNLLHRTQYNPHYYNNIIRQQPRPPLPMLIPPPPVEPSSYTSVRMENTTSIPTIWESSKTYFATSAPVITNYVTPPPKPKPVDSKTPENVEYLNTISSDRFKFPSMTEKPSYLHILLGKEVSNTYTSTVGTTTITTEPALTTDPLFSHYNQPVEPMKGPMYMIIQGHSKVRKYGATELDRLSDMSLQDNNEINRNGLDYINLRESRQLSFDDFLPFDDDTINEAFKVVVEKQAEGSGFGAVLTKAIFPSQLIKNLSPITERTKLKSRQ